MATTSFASSADLGEKEQTLEVLADGVYALTAEGDPNIGAIEGEDFVVCFEALATPVAAQSWLTKLREHTDKPVRYLVLSHYHAVRVLGASAFDAETIIAHDNTLALIHERGKQDWESEFGRMPRLAKGADSVPGLTWPTMTFSDTLSIELGGDRGTCPAVERVHPVLDGVLSGGRVPRLAMVAWDGGGVPIRRRADRHLGVWQSRGAIQPQNPK